MTYTENDLVLCTVDKVENTICFVHLPNGAKGTIISSEIAPGRIKFMRQYVVPHKKIVCKVLKVSSDHVELSLRRVGPKEKKQVMQDYKQELANKVAFKRILGPDFITIKAKITKKYPELIDFIHEARQNNTLLAQFIPKQHIDQLEKIITKKKRQVELKYTIEIKCLAEDGIKRIKEVFNIHNEKIKITYISAGKFTLKLKADDFKEGKKEMYEILETIEQKAKKLSCEIAHKEEKQ